MRRNTPPTARRIRRIAMPMLAMVALLFTSMAAPGAAVRAAVPSSSFYVESDPGDPIGSGRTGLATSDDSTFEVYLHSTFQTAVSVSGEIGFFLVYAYGPNGTELEAGQTYANAAYLNHAGPTQATLAPYWDGSGSCPVGEETVGAFTVHDVGYADGLFTRLSMSFRVDCGETTGSLHGELRYGSASPAYAAVLQDPTGSAPGVFAGIGVGMTSETTTFTLTNVGASALAVGAASTSGADPDDFLILDDECSGSSLASGEACTLGVRFKPSGAGNRSSVLSLPVGTAAGHRRIALTGTGLIPTTTTLDAPSVMVFGPFTVTGHVDPAPVLEGGYIPGLAFRVDGNLVGGAPIDFERRCGDATRPGTGHSLGRGDMGWLARLRGKLKRTHHGRSRSGDQYHPQFQSQPRSVDADGDADGSRREYGRGDLRRRHAHGARPDGWRGSREHPGRAWHDHADHYDQHVDGEPRVDGDVQRP